MSRMLHTASYWDALTRRLASDERGVSVVITGIALALLMGFAGLAIDVGYWLNATRGLQAAADQAAYSAAAAAGSTGCASTTAATQAIAIIAARGYPVTGGTTTTSGDTTTIDRKSTRLNSSHRL